MRRRTAASTLALTAALLLSLAPAATAATRGPQGPPGSIDVTYDVTGSTTVARSNLTVAFKPTVISSTLLPSSELRSNLPLAPVKVSYLAYGFLPSTATVVFTQVKPAAGLLQITDTGLSVTSTAQYVVSLRNVAFGGVDAHVGPTCQTVRPVTVNVSTPAGQSFDISNGGTLSGSYSIGRFANCGKASTLINELVPGDSNTITLQLSNGQIQG